MTTLSKAQIRMLRSLATSGRTDGTVGTIAALEKRGLVLFRQREGSPQGWMETVIAAAGLRAIG